MSAWRSIRRAVAPPQVMATVFGVFLVTYRRVPANRLCPVRHRSIHTGDQVWRQYRNTTEERDTPTFSTLRVQGAIGRAQDSTDRHTG